MRVRCSKVCSHRRQSGQPLTLSSQSGAGIEADVHGAVQGTSEEKDLTRAFLAIWLGAKPPHPGVKAGLLGGACSAGDGGKRPSGVMAHGGVDTARASPQREERGRGNTASTPYNGVTSA